MRFEEALEIMRNERDAKFRLSEWENETYIYVNAHGLLVMRHYDECIPFQLSGVQLMQTNWQRCKPTKKFDLTELNNGYEFTWGANNFYIVQDRAGYHVSSSNSAKTMNALYFPSILEPELRGMVDAVNKKEAVFV
jgi:hypothetical protein